MARTVLGVFTDQASAESAINALQDLDYNPRDVSIVLQDRTTAENISDNTGASDVAGGAAAGITTGAVIGGLAGLVAAFTLPGLGALFIGGPLATALGLTGAAATTASGAVTGAVAGGLLGALTGLGVPEDDARYYESRVAEGAILVLVPARAGEEQEVVSVLEDMGASDIKTFGKARRDYAMDDYGPAYYAKGGRSRRRRTGE
jgi:uncharacterized membrane protein